VACSTPSPDAQGEKWFSQPLFAPLLFLALSGEFLSAFFGMDENIIGIAQFLVARISDLSCPDTCVDGGDFFPQPAKKKLF
jgi:hypothetical protein